MSFITLHVAFITLGIDKREKTVIFLCIKEDKMDYCVRCCSPADSYTRLCDKCKSELLSMVGVSSETINEPDNNEQNSEVIAG
jgi:predicted amidophosphoribosyltransferase